MLEEVDDDGGFVSSLQISPPGPLRSAEEERERGDYWRDEAIVYRLTLWSEKTGERRARQKLTAHLRTQPLRDAVAALKASGDYENPNQAATWLIDKTPPDPGDENPKARATVWGYDVDNPTVDNPPSRERAIRNLANRIRLFAER